MNFTDLTEAARHVIETMLCSACKGTGTDWSTYIGGTHLRPSEVEPCGKCLDNPGIDPGRRESIHLLTDS